MLILATPLLSRHSMCRRDDRQRAAQTKCLAPRSDTFSSAARSLRWDHPFLENEAAIEATFAGGNNGEGVLGALVKREALDA
jgi:hypothetical protein